MKLFILHGWTYHADETWRPLLQMLSERGIPYEFLSIPGLTDGTNPVWTLDEYVEWLRGKTSAYDTCILYGHSNGGRISLAFAARYPEKVARLILEDSAGIPASGLRRIKKDIFKQIARIGRFFSRFAILRRILYKLLREHDYERATPEMRKTMTNLLSVDLSKILEKIRCPTLIIWGAQDRITPLKDGKLLHRGISGSRMVVIPDARHSPHITHAQRVAELIEDEVNHS